MMPFTRQRSYESPNTTICCLDEHWHHPFAPSSECLILKLKEPPGRIEDLLSPKSNIHITEQPFLDEHSSNTGSKEKDDATNQDGYSADIDSETQSFTPDQTYEDETYKNFSPISKCSQDISSLQPLQLENQTPNPQALDTWLSTLFNNTLEGHTSGIPFEGGAEEQIPLEDDCPFCSQPLGDLRDQHLLKCEHAHKEREREERMTWLLARGQTLRKGKGGRRRGGRV